MLVALVEHPDKVRYPVGDFGIDPDVTASKRRRWLQQMAETPANGRRRGTRARRQRSSTLRIATADGRRGRSSITWRTPT